MQRKHVVVINTTYWEMQNLDKQIKTHTHFLMLNRILLCQKNYNIFKCPIAYSISSKTRQHGIVQTNISLNDSVSTGLGQNKWKQIQHFFSEFLFPLFLIWVFFTELFNVIFMQLFQIICDVYWNKVSTIFYK